jgi:hypothetical protein
MIMLFNRPRKNNTVKKPPLGVWVTAKEGVVTLVHSGIHCPMTPDLARKLSMELVRFADLADSFASNEVEHATANT